MGPFTNGSFESPVFSAGGHALASGSTDITGWTLGGPGTVSIVNGAAAGVVDPKDGAQQIDFNSGNTEAGATLTQTFATTAGQTYTVSFYVGRVGPGGGTVSLQGQVTSGAGGVLGSLAVVAPETQGYGPVQTFNFTATTASSTLTFTDTSTATVAVDVLLDNVRVDAGSGSCVTPPGGLVDWWPGNGNANDVVGGNNGTLIGGASFTAGEVGQAFSLDGVDDFVSFADSPALRPTNLTIEGWFNFATVGGIRILVAKTAGTTFESYVIYASDGDIVAGVGTPAGTTPILQYSLNPVVGTWYHIAYTFDDTANTHALYIDGVLRASGVNNTTIGYDTNPVTLGAEFENGAPNFFFAGKIDEVS
ncbi:MAG: LamG-like jellyroll fold domain-containing protein, partial [bacterium]